MTRQGQAMVSHGSIPKKTTRKLPPLDRDAIVNEFLPSIRIHAARLKQLAASLRATWYEQKALLVLRNGHHVWLR